MSTSIKELDELDEEELLRVLKQSGNAYARACAWVLLDHILDEPDIEDLEAELQALRERRETYQ